MPPRYAYWTIIAGGLPTAFRAADREELLPTFQRIKEKHPDAEMRYFARGKLWESQEAARATDRRSGNRRNNDARRGQPSLSDQARRPKPEGPPRETRGRDWRPGGEHRDPRQKFIDQKAQRNAALRKQRWERKNAPPRERPHGDPPRTEIRPHNDPRRPASGYRGGGKTRFTQQRPSPRKPWMRDQGTPEPAQPPRPRGPNREPKRSEEPEPTPPPRVDQPTVPPPGPPERGQPHQRRRYQPGGKFSKGPRR